VAIHDIDMKPIGAGRFHGLDFVPEAAEISGQYGRRDFDRLHLGYLSHARGKETVGIMAVRQREKIAASRHALGLFGKILRGLIQDKPLMVR
jgi:hypothetical protein